MKISLIHCLIASVLISPVSAAKKTGGSSTATTGTTSASSTSTLRGTGQGRCFIGDYEVDVSTTCCTGWGSLQNAKNQTLAAKQAECENEVLETMLSDILEYCNENTTECSIDYRDFSCDEEYIATCSEIGNYAEYDETSVCTYTDGTVLTTVSLDKAFCVPAMCTSSEVKKLLEVPAVIQGGVGGTCQFEELENIKVNGVNLTDFTPYTSSGEGTGEDGNILVLVIIVVVVVLICGAGCFFCRQKSGKSTQVDTSAEGGKSTQADTSAEGVKTTQADTSAEGVKTTQADTSAEA